MGPNTPGGFSLWGIQHSYEMTSVGNPTLLKNEVCVEPSALTSVLAKINSGLIDGV